MRHATCDMRHATCNMRHATCDMQHATCNMQHAATIVWAQVRCLHLASRMYACRMQISTPTSGCMLHVACYMSHVACRMSHVACRMSHVVCRMLHGACCMFRCALSRQGVASLAELRPNCMQRYGATRPQDRRRPEVALPHCARRDCRRQECLREHGGGA